MEVEQKFNLHHRKYGMGYPKSAEFACSVITLSILLESDYNHFIGSEYNPEDNSSL